MFALLMRAATYGCACGVGLLELLPQALVMSSSWSTSSSSSSGIEISGMSIGISIAAILDVVAGYSKPV